MVQVIQFPSRIPFVNKLTQIGGFYNRKWQIAMYKLSCMEGTEAVNPSGRFPKTLANDYKS